MTREEIIKTLESCGYRKDSAATKKNHYSVTKSKSLTKKQVENRNSTGWGKGEYIIAEYSNDELDIDKILDGWKRLTAKYKNQYLILEVNKEVWKIYDYDGNELGGDDYIKELFEGRVTADGSLQKIFFGCPGTGKSYTINELVKVEKAADRLEVASMTPIERAELFDKYLRSHGYTVNDSGKLSNGYTKVLTRGDDAAIASTAIGENVSAICEITSPDTIQVIINFLENDQKGIEHNSKRSNKAPSAALKQYKNLLSEGFSETVFRTTFHPDTDYAAFVGCYKPTTNPDGRITYTFRPQIFTDAYVAAWKNPRRKVYLIIEEINRGNCAQIFGDIFQLLDRKNGYSEYPIKADNDLADYLEKQLGEGAEGIACRQLCLPPNLIIYATMNTSDQSLFPMDSAFKRRWDWEYIQIDPECPNSQFTIEVKGIKYSWSDFITKVNKRITDLTDSEDKMLGNFFIKDNINEKEFKSKVMFYLWSEICKDYVHSDTFFKTKLTKDSKEEEFTFSQLYGENASAILEGFMKYLEINEAVKDTDNVQNDDASADDDNDDNDDSNS